MPIKVTPHGIEIGGVVHALYSGCAHYWRIERDKWPLILDNVVEMGFKFICTYIPWSVHELERGQFDFGEEDPNKNIAEFIDLCAEKGLFVLVRPGPHINAELTFFGYPERVLKMPEIQMRTADDTPAILPVPPRFFAAPSYASEEFYEEVGIYFDALCPILAPRRYPDGPIVGIQSDNEMSFFFRTAPFDVDYSAASVDLYHKYIRSKYENDIESLNKAYSTEHPDFGRVMPPRRYDARSATDLPYYFDWLEYKEYYVYHGIQRITRMLRERGLSDIFYFHNYPTAPPTSPFHIPKTESVVDIVGVDLYKSRKEYAAVRDASRFLTGTSRFPFIPEFGSGTWLWWQPLFLRDQELTTRAALMNGIKGINFYMIVDRERWYGAPVARDGRIRPKHFSFYQKLNRFIRDNRFNEYKMHSDVLLLSMREYERMEQVSSLLDPLPYVGGEMPPDWFADPRTLSGLRDPVAALYKRQWRAFMMGFTQAGFPVTIADSAIDPAMFEQYPIIVVPSFDFMNMALQRHLLVYAFKGGVLVLGPRMPTLDEFMRRDSKFSSHALKAVAHHERLNVGGLVFERADVFDTKRPFLGSGDHVCAYTSPAEKGTIIHLGFVFQDYTGYERSPGLAAVMNKIAGVAGLKPVCQPDDPLIETVLHERGPDRLLFAANPTGAARKTVIHIAHDDSLQDAETGELFTGPSPQVEIKEYTVRIFHLHGSCRSQT
jgi:beta-galactosidase